MADPNPTQIQCVSLTCDYAIDPTWDFCPYCGEDNRPPSRRKDPIRRHRHAYLHDSGCCLICGEPKDEPYSFGRKWRVGIATVMFAISILCFLTSLNIYLAGHDKPAIAGNYIRSWYGQEVRHHRRRSYRTYYSTRGYDWTVNFMIMGAAAGIFGAALFLKTPMSWFDKNPNWN